MAAFTYTNRANFLAAAAEDTIVGNSGSDSLIFSGGVTLEAADFDSPLLDAARLNATTRIERLYFSNTASSVVLGSGAQSFGIASVFGGTGADTIDASLYTAATTLHGAGGEDHISGGSGNDSLSGGAGNDTLIGGEGNDTLNGGADADSMVGGVGNDYYLVDHLGDVVFELENEGTDSVLVSVDGYTLADHVEWLIFAASGVVSATSNNTSARVIGNSLANSIFAGSGGDTLDGGSGNDTLVGGSGNDSLFGGAGNDRLLGGDGDDTLDGGANLDWLEGGDGNDSLFGGAANDTLLGGNGNDTLDGGTGSDSMLGGDGDDFYVVDNAGDEVIELFDEGTDSVLTFLNNYTLPDHVEWLILAEGATILTGTGNALNNTLVGNSQNNTFNGGAGADSMVGGWGNDSYVVDNLGDVVLEFAGQGSDSLLANVDNYTLPGHVEFMTLGAGVIRATGNATGATIIGNNLANSIFGGAGDDTIDGGTGDDWIEGGGGNNSLIGGGNADTLIGGSGNDTLDGGGGNDWLDGGGGINSLVGGVGDDTFVVRNAADVVVEAGGGGTDWVFSHLTAYTLPGNVEHLSLAGGAVSGTGNEGNNSLYGNAGNNSLFGGSGDDTLFGDAGDDTLTGLTGANRLIGGSGNDFYVIGPDDIVVELDGEGVDSVLVNFDGFNLSAAQRVEWIILDQVPGVLSATGNNQANTLVGNSLNNTLNGAAGADSMAGGLGDDFYFVDDLGDVIFELAGQGTDSVLANVDNYTLAGNVEYMTLGLGIVRGTLGPTSATLLGNASNNSLFGGAGDDTIDGGAGADWIEGGAGADSLVGGDGNDTILGGLGNDWIEGGANNDSLLGGDGNDTLIGDAGNDQLFGGDGNDSLLGGDGNDTLYGGNGNDTLDGGLNADSLVGGDGNDFYVVNGPSDVVFELAGQGSDSVLANLSYTLTDHVEWLILAEGAGILTGTGNAQNNTIVGNANGNTLDGGAGADSMAGGLGDDYYIVDNLGDVVLEFAGQGADSLLANVDNYTLPGHLEFMTLGAGVIRATSNAMGATILGNNLANSIFGGAGDDTIDGGTGDDWIEGTAGNNSLLGGGGADSLFGGVGDDTLDGGTGNDYLDGVGGVNSLVGGTGNDTYVVRDENDAVVELAGQGTDWVFSHLGAYTLPGNVEHLSLAGGAVSGTGNAENNSLHGNAGNNSLFAGAANDTLFGYGGDDTLVGLIGANRLIGGPGDDFYVIGSSDTIVELEGEGVDSVLVNFDGFNLSAAQRVEWIILDQVPGVFSATGNNQANTLVGNSLNNTLNGAAGADSMAGGLGDDFYFVDDLGDVVFELAGQGTDSVLANVDNYTLAGNVEYMTLGLGIVRGTLGPTSATLMGNASNNSLFGGAGDDTIDGGAGADWIEGGLGNDSLVGGDGNDTILGGGGNDTIDGGAGNDSIVAGAGDNFVLAGGGNDTVLGGDGNDTLDGGDGNDSLVGGDGDDSLTGGAGLDTLLGGAGDDTLDGGSGNDILDGGPGADRMVGGLGNDTFFVDNLGDVVIEFEGEGIDWVVSAVNNHTLAANVEHLSLLGGVANGFGNSLDNSIFGNAENNSLFGGAGNDTLIGDAGNDTLNGGPGDDSLIGGLGDDYYIVDSLNDRIFEAVGEGMDSVLLNVDAYNLVNTVQVEWMIFGAGLDVVSATGNSLANTILGNAGNNTINGGPGADSMAGGDGDDFYFADNIDDRVYELPGEGIDTVRAAVNNYTLDDNVDVLILVNTAGIITGTGNTIDNTLVGNALGNSLFGIGGNNSLDGGGGNDTLVGGDGNDTLNGGTGNDWMIGGAGDDLYFVDAGGDVVVELEGGGTDSVIATVNHTLADHVEYLELQGTAVRGIGNSLDNTLVGNSLGNSLNGGVGADTMIGGLGNDTYFVDNLGDVVVEELNEGTDIVISSVNNFVLPNHVEGLILTNTDGVFNGSGNSQANTITGNNLDNSLFGGAGDDTLVGGAGNDTLNGGTGNDSLVGGTGDDFYIVDSLSDVVVEIAGQGTDSVLANVENLTLADHVEVLILGTGIVAGYGNSLDNSVIGNASNNSLFGGDGNDTLFGLAGSDTLDGVSGNNSLVGGTGDDFYIVRSVGDSILELSGGGIDSVLAHLPSYTLPAFVEHLILGDGGISGFGNTLNNSLYGNNGDNSLDGVAGVNTMIGGEGNDTYFVRSLSDVVVEDNEQGHDWIVVEFSGYTLQNHVEGLLLLGAATYGAGNAGPNTLVGNSVLANSLSGGAGDDTLVGGSGNDTLDGGPGADSMVGGDGDDYYIVDDAGDEIVDSSGIDSVLLNLSGGYTLPDGIEHLILGTGDMGAGNALSNSLIGNSLNNTLSAGTGGINTLIGGLGDDYYILNSLDDLIIEFPDGGIDTVYVNFPGFDLSMAPNVENLVLGPLAGGSLLLGDSGNNLLIGNDLDNTLDGVGGINTLVGGDGNDFYEIRHLDDLVIENPDEGIDSVRSHVSYYALTPNVNVLILAPGAVTGVGNDLDNTLIGNSTFNSLFGGAGNDWIDASAGGNNTLNGGTGADTMIGGPGNDYFVVDDPGDSVVGGGGNDGIISLIEDYTLPLAFNILVLGQGVQRGTGNANNNSLTGNSLANTLAAGAAGADTLIGGIGHDYYIINSADDLVVERALEGTDTVEFSGFATYTLPANVERLVLGAGAVDGYGNSLNNTLSGNAGNNSLFGGAGRDSLFGGDGNDTLWGTDASRRNEIDTLTGGGGADLFVLGDASVVFYNDGLASQVGNTDYALITDFNPAEGDRLQLRGAAASYYLGAHTVTGLTAHQGLFLELGAVDELIAIIQPGPGAPELTNSNVIENAVFV